MPAYRQEGINLIRHGFSLAEKFKIHHHHFLLPPPYFPLPSSIWRPTTRFFSFFLFTNPFIVPFVIRLACTDSLFGEKVSKSTREQTRVDSEIWSFTFPSRHVSTSLHYPNHPSSVHIHWQTYETHCLRQVSSRPRSLASLHSLWVFLSHIANNSSTHMSYSSLSFLKLDTHTLGFWTVGDFFPPAFQCPHEVERIGSLGDGGKWLCGLSRLEHKRDCVVYVFGTWFLPLFYLSIYPYSTNQSDFNIILGMLQSRISNSHRHPQRIMETKLLFQQKKKNTRVCL